ncbi:zinc ribbon domain-containing protein [Dapis sp. BLCC M229]|uniref:zinc ribbon domain-containing protein n=1 Tax=Dapis sp. BLCC M229 TaxID=3400188 RepID=UPI003CF0283F
MNVMAIPPAYTSQTSHQCLHIHLVPDKYYRSGKNFKCGNCDRACDADYNGAKMI